MRSNSGLPKQVNFCYAIGMLSIMSLAGCWPGNNPSKAEISSAEAFEGEWRTTGTWDLSGPLGSGMTVGDLVAESLVIEAVKAAGVPGLLEDKTESLLDDAIGDEVAAYVDGRIPDEMKPGGGIYEALSAVLASVDVETELVIDTTGDDSSRIEGAEQILALSFNLEETTTTALLDAVPLLSIEADIEGRGRDKDVLSVFDHEFALRYDQLVMWILENELGVDLDAWAEALDNAVNCEAIVSDIVGEALSFTVLDQAVEISENDIASACDSVREETREKALGLFRKDTGVIVGGRLNATERSGSRIDAFETDEAYGGELTTFSEHLAPVIGVEMVGERQ